MREWFGRNWSFLVVIMAVLVGGYSTYLGGTTEFLYWFFIGWYQLGFLYSFCGLWIIFFILGVLWLIGRHSMNWPLQVRKSAIILTIISVLIASLSFFSVNFLVLTLGYRDHANSMRLDGHVYHLAYAFDDGEESYYLYRCGSLGWICKRIDTIPLRQSYYELNLCSVSKSYIPI